MDSNNSSPEDGLDTHSRRDPIDGSARPIESDTNMSSEESERSDTESYSSLPLIHSNPGMSREERSEGSESPYFPYSPDEEGSESERDSLTLRRNDDESTTRNSIFLSFLEETLMVRDINVYEMLLQLENDFTRYPMSLLHEVATHKCESFDLEQLGMGSLADVLSFFPNIEEFLSLAYNSKNSGHYEKKFKESQEEENSRRYREMLIAIRVYFLEEENRRLRSELEELRSKASQLAEAYNNLKKE